MIDLHCHILPGIDDGPQDIERSLSMLRLAVMNGITHAVVTPHIHPGRYDNQRENIKRVFDTLKQRVRQEKIQIKLGMAAEVRIDPLIMTMLEKEQIPFIGTVDEKNILLVEMPHSHIPAGADKFLQWLFNNKIQPMIAHPERNKEIMRNFDRLMPFIEMGCLVQVTAGSVAGSFGHEAYKVAARLLENGSVDILATDAHNTQHRPPEMFPGMEAAADIVGRGKALELVLDNPMKLAASQFSTSTVDIVL
ncbi:MAG: capsular biosynthesis protein [Gammaproteobacteria bacterium]|nr:capsular biosynthesis protein [Gammaproteobacteria bacterium]